MHIIYKNNVIANIKIMMRKKQLCSTHITIKFETSNKEIKSNYQEKKYTSQKEISTYIQIDEEKSEV